MRRAQGCANRASERKKGRQTRSVSCTRRVVTRRGGARRRLTPPPAYPRRRHQAAAGGLFALEPAAMPTAGSATTAVIRREPLRSTCRAARGHDDVDGDGTPRVASQPRSHGNGRAVVWSSIQTADSAPPSSSGLESVEVGDQPGAHRRPRQLFPRDGVRRRHVHAREHGHPAEMRCDLVASQAHHRQLQ